MPWHVATLKIKYMGLIYDFHSNSFIARNSATWQSRLVFFFKDNEKDEILTPTENEGERERKSRRKAGLGLTTLWYSKLMILIK